MIILETNMGEIHINVDADKAPISAKNFTDYVEDGFFDGTIFHRVIPGFMVQGGGMTEDMQQKPTKANIENEAKNGLKNVKYSLAMARTAAPHSASSQFFINVNDNQFLDFPGQDGWGYCVFGEVVAGKDVVDKEEAYDRIRAANDMRNEGYDILIMARTDANHTHGLKEAIARAQKFYELGADILFVEAPKNKKEMITICNEVPGHKVANIVEGGITPNLSMKELEDIGYKLAIYPLTVMSSAMKAMVKSLDLLFKDEDRSDLLLDFSDLRKKVGFDEYYEISSKYETSKRS